MWRSCGCVGLLVYGCLGGCLGGCGNAPTVELDESVPTQMTPVVTRVAPVAGRAGDVIVIFGMGFVAEAPQNIVLMGGAAATAATYGLASPAAAGEIEQLTFTVPAGASAGSTTVTVVAIDHVSNSDVAFTVNP